MQEFGAWLTLQCVLTQHVLFSCYALKYMGSFSQSLVSACY